MMCYNKASLEGLFYVWLELTEVIVSGDEDMQKHRSLRAGFVVILMISIITMGYSGYQIVYSNNSIEKSIQQWDNLKALQGKSENKEAVIEDNMNKDANLKEVQPVPQIENIDLIGRLIIQSTNDNIPVVNGVSLKDLQQGAGYFQQSTQPGQIGNCIILGHRENVFNKLGDIKLNEKIVFETMEKSYVYSVVETKIVDKINDDLLDPTDASKLTLITCYPIKYTGPVTQRYLVIAELE